MSKTYSSLHNHDGYSFLDGFSKPREWIQAGIDKGIYALAITNHGNLCSALEWYHIGKKLGYKTIIGQEFYIEDKEVVFAGEEERKKLNRYYHMIVLAKNNKGYQNLLRLSTLANDLDRFYYKPRITFDDLIEYQDGLIVTSACQSGFLSRNILNKKIDKAYEYAKLLKNKIEHFYIEILDADTSIDWNREKKELINLGYNPQEKVNIANIQIANELSIPLTIAIDAHIINKEDKKLQDISIKTLSSREETYSQPYYLKTFEELEENIKIKHPYLLELFPRLCQNTRDIADMCNLDLTFRKHLPRIENATRRNLTQLVLDKKRIDLGNENYFNRFKDEMEVIHKNGKIDLIPYFMVLEDLCRWCLENGILVGPGRGSSCGSLVAYALGITHIDPLKYDLLFERFISKSRIEEGSLADIDLDFSDQQAVRKYLENKYGEDRVVSIGTIQQIKIKNAWTDVCRAVLGDKFDFAENKVLSKGLPSTNPNADLESVLKITRSGYLSKPKIEEGEINEIIVRDILAKSYDPEATKKWANWIENHPNGKEIYEIMVRTLGTPRQPSVHASAVLVTDDPYYTFIPAMKNKEVKITQFTADWCEKAGALKFDILGLSALKIFKDCLKSIKDRLGIDINIYKDIPLDDDKIYENFRIGNTDTIFQFNTQLSKHILSIIKPASILELSNTTAIARPGPLSNNIQEDYRIAKESDAIEYQHPKMAEICKDTWGCIIYQEQVMKFFNVIGGFSLAESEIVRKAFSKKKVELINGYKERFISFAISKLEPVVSEKRANELWDYIYRYSSYSFNKSHSVAYSYLAYISMYFKIYYPLDWWNAVLMNCSDDDFIGYYPMLQDIIREPDINESKDTFYIKDEQIYIPIGKIKGLGPVAVKNIIGNQPYSSFEDFFKRINKSCVNKNIVTRLILAGCFSKIETRGLQELLEYYFLLRGDALPKEFKHLDREQIINLQTAAYPYKPANIVKTFSNFFSEKIADIEIIKQKRRGFVCIIGGMAKRVTVRDVRGKKSKYCTFDLHNGFEKISVSLIGSRFLKYRKEVAEDTVVEIFGQVDEYNGEKKFLANAIRKVKLFGTGEENGLN